MMKIGKTISTALFRCFLAATVVPVAAQTPGYTELNVKGRVQIEVPSDWAISDSEQRRRAKELGEKISGTTHSHMASLSARSYPAPSRVFVRVSIISMDPPITQSDVRQEVQASKQQVLKDLSEVWRKGSPTIWAGLAKYGMKEVGHPSFAVEPLGGQIALIIRYGRTSSANSAETMRVAQYHLPLGAEKVLITLSHIESDQQAIATHDRLKNSIVIR